MTVIEWAERIAGFLPENAIYVKIQGAGEEPREIYFEGLEGLERLIDEPIVH